MGTRRVELGSTGKVVARNLARYRKREGLTLRELSSKLAETDRPMAHNTISEIEREARRTDVDDLMALAWALNISPTELLMPETTDGPDWEVELVEATGYPDGVRAGPLLEWFASPYWVKKAVAGVEAMTAPEAVDNAIQEFMNSGAAERAAAKGIAAEMARRFTATRPGQDPQRERDHGA